MNCSSFERWLDAGMPGEGARRALAHAEGCKVCAPALVEARAVEAALRGDAEGAGAPGHRLASAAGVKARAGFVDAVMARVEAEAPRARPAVATLGLETPALWWVRLFADPMSVVSVTLAIVVGVVARVEPGWFTAAAAGSVAYGERAGEALAAWPLLDRPSRAAAAAALAIAPVLIFLAVAVYRTFERALVLATGGRRR